MSRRRANSSCGLPGAWLAGFLCLAALCVSAIEPVPDAPVQRLSVQNYTPDWGDSWATNRICWLIMQENPDIVILPPPGINSGDIPGGTKILSFAGRTAPDLLLEHWWAIRADIKHDVLAPINEYVGYDGYYGIDPLTNERTARTGTPKYRTATGGGEQVLDRNGIIDDDEALWPEWRLYPRITRLVAGPWGHIAQGPDGKPYEGSVVYGLPQAFHTYYGIAYRKDLFAKAGIAVDQPPQTWEEFWRLSQRLTDTGAEVPGARFQRGQRGYGLPSASWQWLLWLYSAGGDCIEQNRTNPRTGDTYSYSMEETEFLDPQTGESLGDQPSDWRATFGDQRGQASVEFFHKMVWQPWLRHPKSGEPIDLSEADLAAGAFTDPATGEAIVFTPDDVIRGAVRHSGDAADSQVELFRRGEVAMILVDLFRLETYKIPPNNLGFMAVPGGPEGEPVVGYYRHFYSLNAELSGPTNKAKRDAAWRTMAILCGPRARKDIIDNKVFQGFAKFLTPEQLKLAGREEYLDQLSPEWRANYATITENARTEPFMGQWGPVSLQLERKVLSVLTTSPNVEPGKLLEEVELEANQRLMFGLPAATKAKYRPWVMGVVVVLALAFAVALVMIVRSYMDKTDTGGQTRGVHTWWFPALMLSPALISVLLWAYYPLVRGSIMAFQDYRISGDSEWVGLDNFVTIFCTRDFWVYLGKTCKFSIMSLALSFVTPIIVAILLTEIPRLRGLFRTVYFLPQVSSALVVMFMWKMLYNPTEFGMLNRILLGMNGLPYGVAVAIKFACLLVVLGIVAMILRLALVNHLSGPRLSIWQVAILGGLGSLLIWGFWSGHVPTLVASIGQPFTLRPQNWLGDPTWAMAAVILPGVWANTGIASLIYIAALKSIDDAAYEASEIDGCGFFEKLRYVTVPYLKPLIAINFIGAFISTFHTMGNIFAMTGGGPGDETMVLSLAIWYEAFAFMKFGTATAMAWVTGLMLIGFTVYQLRILKNVDFRRAGT